MQLRTKASPVSDFVLYTLGRGFRIDRLQSGNLERPMGATECPLSNSRTAFVIAMHSGFPGT